MKFYEQLGLGTNTVDWFRVICVTLCNCQDCI